MDAITQPRQIKERPIIFSAAEVRAILEGRKTQTRRIIKTSISKSEYEPDFYHYTRKTRRGFESVSTSEDGLVKSLCTYGQPGDRLWVRETFWGWHREFEDYVANAKPGSDELMKYPATMMKRANSRILLEIVSVRVERLQDITRGDCMSEGCPFPNIAKETDPRQWYKDLWESIHGSGSWDANPWVWVHEVRMVD